MPPTRSRHCQLKGHLRNRVALEATFSQLGAGSKSPFTPTIFKGRIGQALNLRSGP